MAVAERHALAVVLYLDAQLTGSVIKRNHRFGGVGVLKHVGEAFLGDPVGGDIEPARQREAISGDAQPDAHTTDFWNFDPNAGTHLLTTFYATGQVDTSRYAHHTISFNSVTLTAVAKYLLGVMLGFTALAVAVLLWAALRVRKRGAAGRKTSLAMRSVLAFVVGLGGWFSGALIVLTFWTTVPLSDELPGVISASVPVALGLYLAWTHRDAGRAAKIRGLLAASVGALLGGWYGYTVIPGFIGLFATIIGAIAAGNIALIALGLWGDRLTRPAAVPPRDVAIEV
jgi:hypothetical protein